MRATTCLVAASINAALFFSLQTPARESRDECETPRIEPCIAVRIDPCCDLRRRMCAVTLEITRILSEASLNSDGMFSVEAASPGLVIVALPRRSDCIVRAWTAIESIGLEPESLVLEAEGGRP